MRNKAFKAFCKIPMNLQLFAESGDGTGTGGEGGNGDGAGGAGGSEGDKQEECRQNQRYQNAQE